MEVSEQLHVPAALPQYEKILSPSQTRKKIKSAKSKAFKRNILSLAWNWSVKYKFKYT